ncbi:hypothetical protein DCAR_0520586 [Daucus carota subsp. sativus]|uniref:Uncharacterized protein n=1 Tax=Daucus carota subsp. sativus TaxID=79200 RepID=A0A162A1K2_DAUCS|nr:hypothetical protein DCAR_0520586 [Daucus carota subsp. sativus]
MTISEEPIINPYTLPHTLTAHKRAISAVKFSDDGALLGTSSADKNVKTWSPHTGALIQDFFGHDLGISDLAFSPDNRFLVACSADKTDRLWDLNATTPSKP